METVRRGRAPPESRNQRGSALPENRGPPWDVTAEWEAIDQLARAKALAGFGTWSLELGTGLVTWSPELYAIFGMDPTATPLEGEAWLAVVHPDDVAVARQAMPTVGVSPRYSIDCRIRRPDGTERSIKVIGDSVFDADGNIIKVHGITQDVTEHRFADRELWDREAELRAIVDSSPNALLRFDRDGDEYRISFANRRVIELTRRPAHEILNRTGREAGFPDDLSDRWHKVLDKAFAGEETRLDFMLDLPDGNHWFHARVVPVDPENGIVVHALAVVLDVTDAYSRAAQLRALVEGSPDTIVRVDRQLRFVASNVAFARRVGLTHDQVIGRTHAELGLPLDLVETVQAQLTRVFDTREVQTFEVRAQDLEDEWRWFESTAAPEFDPDGVAAHVVVSTRDITSRKNAEEALAHRVLHDDLTGLANRHGLLIDVGRALERQVRTGKAVALLVLDLDRFKTVNDSLGHETGDRLLVKVARRLRRELVPTNTLARLGGDEFGVLLEDITDELEPARVAGCLVRALREPISVDEHELRTTASVGIVVTVDGTEVPGDLFSHADAAMYLAKERGRDRHEFFDEHLGKRADDRLELEGALRRGVERGELRVHYQPEVDLTSGCVTGAEALVRWEHPTRGLLMAGQFIRTAEESGQIARIGEFVLDETCAQIARWRAEDPDRDFVVSMNVSPGELAHRSFPDRVRAALTLHGVEPRDLRLEIVETTLVVDTPTVRRNLDIIDKEIGLEFAIDDFGTGYSALAYLKRLPAGVLKIDQTFVAGLPEDAGDRGIVASVVALARSLGLRTTAEGVETNGQAAVLRALGVDAAQGYLYGRAVPADEFPMDTRLTAQAAGIAG